MLLIPTSLKDYLKQSYVSMTFAFVNVVVFLFLINQNPANFQTLWSFNAFYAESVLEGEYFRLIAWLFVHSSFLQLFFTILALIIIGSNLEKLMGPFRFAGFYLLSGILAGGVLTYMHTSGSPTNSILFGAAPSVAGVISGLLFIQLRRPRWFDNTDVRVMWIFVAVYLIVIFGGLVLRLSPQISLVIYISGLVAGAVLSLILMPKDRYDN